MVEMFDVNTAAPTVNQPSDLFARKYCSVEALRRYPTQMPKAVMPNRYRDQHGGIHRVHRPVQRLHSVLPALPGSRQAGTNAP